MALAPLPHIEALGAYKVTPQEAWLPEAPLDIAKMDWNEGAFFPGFLQRDLAEAIREPRFTNWYSDYSALELTAALSTWLGIPATRILTFPGSDVALDILIRCYVGVGTTVLVPTPTYDNFPVYVQQAGARVVPIALERPFVFSSERLLQHKDLQPSAVYLCSPNNPVGYLIGQQEVESICHSLPDTLVILDQAYVEFAESNDCSHLIGSCPNLVVVRTFSKAFSLAGLRVSFVLANENIQSVLRRVRNGKNLSMLAQVAARSMLRNYGAVQDHVRHIQNLRVLCARELTHLVDHVYPSQGNFILFESDLATDILRRLRSERINIRDKRATAGGLRVSITSKGEINRFLKVVETTVKGQHGATPGSEL